MTLHRIITVMFTVIGISALSVGCDNKQTQEKKLVMATSADYPPFEYLQNGEIVGLEVDIAFEVAKIMGVKLEIKDLDFSSLIPTLNNNQADFIMAALSASPQRKENVDFSETYYQGYVTLLSKKDSNIKGLEDLKDKTIGVQMGSVWEIFAKDKAHKIPGLIVYSAAKLPQLIEELKIGRIAATIVEEDQAIQFSKANPGLNFYMLDELGTGFSAAFAKGSPLQGEFNKALDQLKRNGELEKIKQKWLKTK